MIKIVFILFVLIVTYCETRKLILKNGTVICFQIMAARNNPFDGVCGSDGRTYINIYNLKCVQETEDGKQVNLQFSHKRTCFGDLNRTQIQNAILVFVIVSRLKIDSTLTKKMCLFKFHCSTHCIYVVWLVFWLVCAGAFIGPYEHAYGSWDGPCGKRRNIFPTI